ncbi:hypothetical protein EMIHUDRAFT_223312 [Emiliania huxleyi CCMP1516]|uniref:Uncharacterized protein n=2 Tax=Emiliania huxleyi TaxID=2903 RepID=A0A0D3KVJ9_EMIH1|nr:hypothetical protein EMIHUDRAFT_223312 [Emiliania huxleyi CCMP1516]EOD39784.1 hypothetical protein EMIHUDRAFT_223312 [Emiliania huxleyi CCMP1516]|eukprot:XP_005792213.1 hypothetical protein EMIHUDRAFT_223312 [Emiliania huxleyi CCMP1516]
MQLARLAAVLLSALFMLCSADKHKPASDEKPHVPHRKPQTYGFWRQNTGSVQYRATQTRDVDYDPGDDVIPLLTALRAAHERRREPPIIDRRDEVLGAHDRQARYNGSVAAQLRTNHNLWDVQWHKVIPYPPARYTPFERLDKSRIAVATILHLPSGSAGKNERFASKPLETLLCVLLILKAELVSTGRLDGVDFVVLHDNVPDVWLSDLNASGVKTVRMPLPKLSLYPTEFCAANLLKAHLLSLTQYERVLYTDADMLPTGSWRDIFEYEYPEGLVGEMMGVGFWGNMFLIRPNATQHQALWPSAHHRRFSLSRGWENRGLHVWPTPGAAPLCTTFVDFFDHASALWMYRCEKFHIVSWLWSSAACDQGWLFWAFNLTGHSTFRDLRGYGADEQRCMHSADRYVHYAGINKPWLLNPNARKGNIDTKSWWVLLESLAKREGKHLIDQKCPGLSGH